MKNYYEQLDIAQDLALRDFDRISSDFSLDLDDSYFDMDVD